jgi:hypothetical protein
MAAGPQAAAQTASLTFDDGNAPADQGIYPAGAKFIISLNLSFVPGGNVSNLAGLSYYIEQQNPLAPFYFSITNRDSSGSQFTFFQTPNPTYPQSLTPSSPSDLGGGTLSGAGLSMGNYFIANLNVSISPSAAPGTYIIENTTVAPKRSTITDDHGHTFPIPKTTYTISVVPFTITATSGSGSVTLQGQGVPNSVNRIEASPDLSANSFQTLQLVTPDQSGAFSYTDMNPGTARFYRLTYP